MWVYKEFIIFLKLKILRKKFKLWNSQYQIEPKFHPQQFGAVLSIL